LFFVENIFFRQTAIADLRVAFPVSNQIFMNRRCLQLRFMTLQSNIASAQLWVEVTRGRSKIRRFRSFALCYRGSVCVCVCVCVRTRNAYGRMRAHVYPLIKWGSVDK